MIARTWRGWTRADDADAYVEYLLRTGITEYRATEGNRAAFVLRRDVDERTEFVTFTLWDSLDASAASRVTTSSARSSTRKTAASWSIARRPCAFRSHRTRLNRAFPSRFAG